MNPAWLIRARHGSPNPSPIHGALLVSQTIDRLASPAIPWRRGERNVLSDRVRIGPAIPGMNAQG